jgi:FRG domain
MSELLVPTRPTCPWEKPITSIGDLISVIEAWQKNYEISADPRTLSQIWYRGNKKAYPNPLRPKVYRDGFEKRAGQLYKAQPDATSRMNLERQMFKEFRTGGAHHFDADDVVDVYFTAQHFGMPTRLLDWTTNPLIALFFAVKDEDCWETDGELYVMDALAMLPKVPAENTDEIPTGVATMRHNYVKWAIGQSFWLPRNKRVAHIAPVRPDYQPGRIGQQSSCFSLHVEGSEDVTNRTLHRFVVDGKKKDKLVSDLRRLNVNHYTIFNDLDNLSCAISNIFGLPRT